MYLSVLESIFRATVLDMLILLIGIKISVGLRFCEAQTMLKMTLKKA